MNIKKILKILPYMKRYNQRRNSIITPSKKIFCSLYFVIYNNKRENEVLIKENNIQNRIEDINKRENEISKKENYIQNKMKI